MKFVSKNVNLRVVLSPGLQAEPQSGFRGKPGLYVRFQDGIAEVRDEETIRMMLDHPGYNSDFICLDEGARDPYASKRVESEPQHVTSELKYGQVVKTVGAAPEKKLPVELEEMIRTRIEEGIKNGLEKIVAYEIEKRAASLEPNRNREIDLNVINTEEEIEEVESEELGEAPGIDESPEITEPVKETGFNYGEEIKKKGGRPKKSN